jgi:hypothetical protein
VSLLSAASANAADTNWRWIWTTPDRVLTDHSPTWTSESGTAKVTFHGNCFSAHLENSHNEPAYDLSGNINGRKVTATANPTDSDAGPRLCDGNIASQYGIERIALLCDDGEFIGLDRPQT